MTGGCGCGCGCGCGGGLKTGRGGGGGTIWFCWRGHSIIRGLIKDMALILLC